MSEQELRLRILQALWDWERSGHRYVPKAWELAEILGVDVQDVIDQYDMLEVDGAIDSYHRYYGDRKGDSTVSITGVGKKLVEQVRQRSTQKLKEEKVAEIPKVFVTYDWKTIENEFGYSKKAFGKKIRFVSDNYKRRIIFRDVEHSFILATLGFSKPAVILAGGVIEELLRIYLKHNNISPTSDTFDGYIRTCEQYGLLKSAISRLSDSVRQFRNLVHLSAEQSEKHMITKATAKAAVASIFTIANDF